MQTTKPALEERSAGSDTIRNLLVKHRELILYGFIGGGAVVIDFLGFVLLHTVLDLPVFAAHAGSVSAAVIFSFTLNAKFNFKTTDRLATRFASFVAVSAVGFLVGYVVIWLLVQLGLAAEMAKLLSLPVVAGVQFILNSKVTFANGSGS